MSTDAVIMLRRNFKHTTRNPVTVFNAVLLPVVIMLMFVYMLGDAFSVGVKYIDYSTPGMILLAVAYGLGATATEVNSDMTTGIINRLRVMDVSRGAVMTGHVVITMLRSLISIAAIIGVAFGLGFRPAASPGDWLAVAGIIVAACFATSWLTVAMGLAAKTPQSAAMARSSAARSCPPPGWARAYASSPSTSPSPRSSSRCAGCWPARRRPAT
jgi:ABC-2 type transport system permease protein